ARRSRNTGRGGSAWATLPSDNSSSAFQVLAARFLRRAATPQWRQGPSCPAARGKIAGPGPRTGAPRRPVGWGGRNSERRAPAGERLSERGETGWLARTQGGRDPQRGSMPVRSTDEDSRPTEDNARRTVSPRPAPSHLHPSAEMAFSAARRPLRSAPCTVA